jgi:hypothetical protein
MQPWYIYCLPDLSHTSHAVVLSALKGMALAPFANPVSVKRRIFCRDKGTGREKVLKFGQDSISHALAQICQNSDDIRNSYFVILHTKHEIESTILYNFMERSAQNWQ